MFAQAISSTQSAAPLTASSSRRDCCDSSSRNEFTRMPVCAFSFGYCWRSCEAITDISAFAPAIVTPGLSLPTTSRRLSLRSSNAWAGSRAGSHISSSRVGKLKCAGITPTIVYTPSSSVTCVPRTDRSPPNARRHSPSLRINAPGAPSWSSAAVNSRPIAG